MLAESPTTVQRQEVQTEHAHPMLTVLTWELRRLAADRVGWGLGGGALLFFALLLWFKHSWNVQTSDGGARFLVLGSSAAGMLLEIVFVLLLIFDMFLPFVTAEGVARDYKQRVHELLMTTAIPSWA
ncbi:MAG: hypothetical protein ACR2JY_17100 [Chloroflexota bacterium]